MNPVTRCINIPQSSKKESLCCRTKRQTYFPLSKNINNNCFKKSVSKYHTSKKTYRYVLSEKKLDSYPVSWVINISDTPHVELKPPQKIESTN